MKYLLFCDCPNGHNLGAATLELADSKLQSAADKIVLLAPELSASECPRCGAPRAEWLYYAQPAPARVPTFEDVQARFEAAPLPKTRVN